MDGIGWPPSAAEGGVTPDVLCKVLLEAARDFATEPISDDIAILAIKRA